jgi:homoprotocatechuate degradation regulator HpaR
MSTARRSRTSPTASIAHRNLPLLLLQAREHVLARFRPLLKANGLTEQQWRIVRALLEKGPLEPREIVTHCRISSPSLAGVLARMEEIGLIERERLEHDQRRLLVSLTTRARAVAQRMAPEVEATYAMLEERVGTERLQAMYDALDELIELVGPAEADDDIT